MDGGAMARIEAVRSFAKSLPDWCADEWAKACDHPFVRATADGSLPRDRFHAWIQQDNRFVEGVERFVRELIAVAPEDDVPGLESGLAALRPELDLFRDFARREEIDLAVAAFAPCNEYVESLRSTIADGYAPALTAYYACERSYLEAWTNVRDRTGSGGAYGEWIENWSSGPFRAYVDWLGSRLDEQALGLADDAQQTLRDVFRRTVELEVRFWDACWHDART
jgi:thiaminase/transcriptional activator TenA